MCGFLWIFMITKLRRYMHLIDVLLMFYVCIDRFWLLYPITLVSTSQLPIHIYIYIYTYGGSTSTWVFVQWASGCQKDQAGCLKVLDQCIYICVYRCDHVWYVHAQVYMHTRHDIPEHVSCTCDMRIYMKTYMLWNDLSLASIWVLSPFFIYIHYRWCVYLCMRACTHTWPCKYMHM